jgi:hypothetical protein
MYPARRPVQERAAPGPPIGRGREAERLTVSIALVVTACPIDSGIQLGRDFGTTVEVVGGLSERDRLLVTPSDTLQEGAAVKVASSAGPS